LRLYTQVQWTEEMIKTCDDKNLFVEQEPTTFSELVFLNEMKSLMIATDKVYDRLNFKDALKLGFFEMQSARDSYVKAAKVQKEKLNKKLILDFIRYQTIALAPICSHIAEYIWTDLLKAGPSITKARWPNVGDVDEVILKKKVYIDNQLHGIRVKVLTAQKKKKQTTKPTKVTITVATSFPDWHVQTVKVLAAFYKEHKAAPSREQMTQLVKADDLLAKNLNVAMALGNILKDEQATTGDAAFVLDMGFDEFQLLKSMSSYLAADLEFAVQVETTDAPKAGNVPGKPSVEFS